VSIVPGRDVPAVPDEWVDAVNRRINDENHDDLCACDGWPDACRHYKPGLWDLGVSLDIAVGVLEPLIRARIAEEMAEQTKLREMGYRDGKFTMELDVAHEILFTLVEAARTTLGDAENYVELELKAQESLDRYVLTIQRAGKLTPHRARLNAEAERDAAVRAAKLAELSRDDFMRASQAEREGGAARLALARSYRLASPSKAVDRAVHTPERVAAYLTARGWSPRPKERNLWDSADGRETVHVHYVATASDYAKRTGLLVSDLASVYKTGELQVLADIAEAS
jgi:hypothetical protein